MGCWTTGRVGRCRVSFPKTPSAGVAAVPEFGHDPPDDRNCLPFCPHGVRLLQVATHTWIYGAYDGRVTFYEEMLTLAYLKSRPKECVPIKTTLAVALTGYYPTKSCIRYVNARSFVRAGRNQTPRPSNTGGCNSKVSIQPVSTRPVVMLYSFIHRNGIGNCTITLNVDAECPFRVISVRAISRPCRPMSAVTPIADKRGCMKFRFLHSSIKMYFSIENNTFRRLALAPQSFLEIGIVPTVGATI